MKPIFFHTKKAVAKIIAKAIEQAKKVLMKCLYDKTLFIHNLFAPLQKVIRAIITQVAPFDYGEKVFLNIVTLLIDI